MSMPAHLERHFCWPGTPHEMAFRHLVPSPFRMGSRGSTGVFVRALEEEPQHRVTVARPYWIAETPVTRAQFRYLAGLAGLDLDPSHLKGDDRRPVETVTWVEARAAAMAMRHEALAFPDAAREVRLPTEAEWEHACRAGTTTEYWSGDGEAALAEVGWYGGNSEKTTHSVKEKPANLFGLYDMHGNVWEWCQDRWDEAAYRKRGADWIDRYEDDDDERTNRVVRGGSWISTAWDCRAAVRFRLHPGSRYWDQGFRLCVSSGSGENKAPEARENMGEQGAGGGGADDPATGAWQGLTPPRSGGGFFPKTEE